MIDRSADYGCLLESVVLFSGMSRRRVFYGSHVWWYWISVRGHEPGTSESWGDRCSWRWRSLFTRRIHWTNICNGHVEDCIEAIRRVDQFYYDLLGGCKWRNPHLKFEEPSSSRALVCMLEFVHNIHGSA